jgi:hypothetical protein
MMTCSDFISLSQPIYESLDRSIMFRHPPKCLAPQRAARYSSIANEGGFLKYIDGKEVVISFHYVGVSRHKDRHQIECFVALLIRLCQQLTGHHVTPSRVSLTHRRNDTSSEFVEFLGGNVDFGEPADEVAFTLAIKQMPVVSADPYLNKFLIAHFEQLPFRSAENTRFISIRC